MNMGGFSGFETTLLYNRCRCGGLLVMPSGATAERNQAHHASRVRFALVRLARMRPIRMTLVRRMRNERSPAIQTPNHLFAFSACGEWVFFVVGGVGGLVNHVLDDVRQVVEGINLVIFKDLFHKFIVRGVVIWHGFISEGGAECWTHSEAF